MVLADSSGEGKLHKSNKGRPAKPRISRPMAMKEPEQKPLTSRKRKMVTASAEKRKAPRAGR